MYAMECRDTSHSAAAIPARRLCKQGLLGHMLAGLLLLLNCSLGM